MSELAEQVLGGKIMLRAGKQYTLTITGRGTTVTGHNERTPDVGTVMWVKDTDQQFRWNGAVWEPYEEKELLPYVNERVGEWVVRNEVPIAWTLPIVNGEPRPGLAQAGHDIIMSVRRTT